MSKRTVKAAIERCDTRRRSWREVMHMAVLARHEASLNFAVTRFEKETSNIILLNRRLRRMPQFRILWANLLTMVGASSLLAWLIVYALMNWRA